jgi:uncharacterized RDD family membrane protein YckC
MSIDVAVIVAVIVGATWLGMVVGLVLPKWVWLTAAVPAAVTAVMSIVPLLYFSAVPAVFGRTLGKAVMGLSVVGLDGRQLSVVRSVVRALAYVVSLVPLFAGFIWVLVDRERRGWHDYIARSRVVYAPRVGRELEVPEPSATGEMARR